MPALALLLMLLGNWHGANAHQASKAPPSFPYLDGRAVPVDFQSLNLELVFDVAARTGKGRARIDLRALETGYPFFDMVPSPTSVRVNGASLGTGALPAISVPDGATTVRVLGQSLQAGTPVTVDIEYAFPASEVTFTTTGASAGLFMSDVGSDRDFLEAYAPANLEFDAMDLRIEIEIRGATAPHRIFTNGRAATLGTNHWSVLFPPYFTSSSPYLHFTEKNVSVAMGEHQGEYGAVPITIYAESSSLAQSGLADAKRVMGELETTYGPYAHDSLTAYVTPGGGGMEHCGATMTSLWAIEHEITHSWFARGVMPANGNSGWMDEAIASWRDNDYPTASGITARPPVNLAAFSPYRRTTPQAAYTSGAKFIGELDYLFKATGGMKPLLAGLFDRYRYQTITTPLFRAELEEATGVKIEALFRRFALGEDVPIAAWSPFPSLPETPWISRHPRPYTREELARYR